MPLATPNLPDTTPFLTPRQILQLVQMRGALALSRSIHGSRVGTPRKWRKGRDRSLGTKDGVHTIHNLRRAVNKGFVYSA